jgi:squalene-hopene/tetraprenyl-beta-curcumene cyclase
MLAVMHLRLPGEQFSTEETTALQNAAVWLLDLQNRDGGWPTFCRGWGTLPFDRSSNDLTAHAVRALAAWQARVTSIPLKLSVRTESAIRRGLKYLQ